MEQIMMPHLPVREDWLATTQEAALEPDLPIIDPHHHLWDRPGARYLFDEIDADLASGHNIRKTVYIQCGSMLRADGPEEMRSVGEVTFAAGAAALSESGHYGPAHVCAGIVGAADLTLGALVEPVLDAMEAAGGGRFRGIRMPTAWHESDQVKASIVSPPPDLLIHPSTAEAVRRLGARGLTLDIWAYQTQLAQVEALARAAPDTVIVLDHCGGILGVGPHAGRREVDFPDWRDAILRIAALPNTWVKLGGLAMHTLGWGLERNARAPGSAELATLWRPYVESCIAAFGPERAMFESNFPVDKGMVSYAVVWNAFKRLAAGAGEAEKAALFHDTAAAVYRL